MKVNHPAQTSARSVMSGSALPPIADGETGRRWTKVTVVESEEDSAGADYVARRCERMLGDAA